MDELYADFSRLADHRPDLRYRGELTKRSWHAWGRSCDAAPLRDRSAPEAPGNSLLPRPALSVAFAITLGKMPRIDTRERCV